MANDPVLPTSPKALAGLKTLLHYMFSDLASPPPTLIHRPASDLFAALVLEHVRMMFLTGMNGGGDEHRQNAIVSWSEEYMLVHLGDPLTVPIMAETLGVSVRQLQNAFRPTVGQSPWERLSAHRLDKARRVLLAGGGNSVTAIAFDCGFSHLSRFAQTYRATFGEAPSDTLRRGRMQGSANRIGDTQTG